MNEDGTLKGRTTGREIGSESSEVYSFLLFCVLTGISVALFRYAYPVFLVILVIDGLATVTESDILVSIDRSAYFLALLLFSVSAHYSLLYLFLEVALAFVALDFSFLLRRVRSTVVDFSVIRSRLVSYVYTALPAFALSYFLLAVYSSGFTTPLAEPVAVLAVSATAALLAIYAVSRYISSRVPSG